MKFLLVLHRLSLKAAKAGMISCTFLSVVLGVGTVGCWGLGQLASVNGSQKIIFLSKSDWDKKKEFCFQELMQSLGYLVFCVLTIIHLKDNQTDQTAEELAIDISLDLHECHKKIEQLMHLKPEFRDCLDNTANDILLVIKTLESFQNSVILPSEIEKPLSILKEMGILKTYQAGKKQLVLTFYNGDCQSFKYNLDGTCELLRYIANLQMNLAEIDDLAFKNQNSEFRNNSPKIKC